MSRFSSIHVTHPAEARGSVACELAKDILVRYGEQMDCGVISPVLPMRRCRLAWQWEYGTCDKIYFLFRLHSVAKKIDEVIY